LAAAVSLRDARDDHAARLVAQRVYVRSRKQLWWDRVTAGLCVAVIGVVLASVLYLLAWSITEDQKTMLCAPVDYHDGAWHNPEGAVVAVSPTEDGILHYVGECK
jgi:hypothetical protein